jgi:Tfp pilus assembly protein PilP
MRKLLFAVMAALILMLTVAPRASAQDFKVEMQGVRARQKAERKALTMKHKFAKQSFKAQDVPKAQRLQMKHQMERERRELRQRQKDELQELKDRQRVLRESQKQL